MLTKSVITLLQVIMLTTGLTVVTLLLVISVNDRSDSSLSLLLVKVLMTGLTVDLSLLLVKVLMTGLTVVMYYYKYLYSQC